MPNIGYGSNKKTRHVMPNGFKRFLVKNEKDVELLLMHNGTFAAEIAHGVSSRKRIAIVEKARVLGVKVTNSNARVRTEEVCLAFLLSSSTSSAADRFSFSSHRHNRICLLDSVFSRWGGRGNWREREKSIMPCKRRCFLCDSRILVCGVGKDENFGAAIPWDLDKRDVPNCALCLLTLTHASNELDPSLISAYSLLTYSIFHPRS